MLLSEAKEILRKNGYRITKNSLDEGLFQAIKDRWNDRKMKKELDKSKEHIKNNKDKNLDSKEGKTYDKEIKRMFDNFQERLKKIRGIKIEDEDQVEEIWDENFQTLFGYLSYKKIKEAAENWEGKYYTDFVRSYLKDLCKQKGVSSLEELLNKEFSKK